MTGCKDNPSPETILAESTLTGAAGKVSYQTRLWDGQTGWIQGTWCESSPSFSAACSVGGRWHRGWGGWLLPGADFLLTNLFMHHACRPWRTTPLWCCCMLGKGTYKKTRPSALGMSDPGVGPIEILELETPPYPCLPCPCPPCPCPPCPCSPCPCPPYPCPPCPCPPCLCPLVI